MILCFLFQSFCLIFFEILQIRGEQRKEKENNMKTRKTFSVMLVICMLLSLVFPSSGGGVKCSLSF